MTYLIILVIIVPSTKIETIQMLKMISAMEARKTLGQIMNEVSIRNDEYIIERAGYPLVAVISVAEYERLKNDREKTRDISLEKIESAIEKTIINVKNQELKKL
ncbi:MAG: type II toxin-antitoxin system Phd/YefM family antitoxin [Nitrospirae bacterium]|nr:type II toxin-antitoxin system Phd/YefM family antitoxin [Nitrospirota bacterium]